MTIRKTNAISLDEIIGLQFECRKCAVKINFPISRQGRMPSACPFCGDSWVVQDRTDLHQKFFSWLEQLIASLKQVAEGTNNVNCALSIELKPEIKLPDGKEV
jgi:Zn finger protein HypA/HybF involved in hydrogenase expression